MPEVPKELQGDRNTIEYWDKLLASGKVNKKTYDYHADRIASSDFGQAVIKATAPKPKQTTAQKAEQELFKTSFEALDLNDPEYLRRKALSDKIDKSLSLVTPDFVNDNEGDVVPVVEKIIKDYPYLQVAESGFGYDELRIVNTVTGEDAVVNLENWSSSRDKEEAEILRGFLDVQMKSEEYVKQKQKVEKIQVQLQVATPTERIELSKKLLEEKAKLNELSTGRYNYAKNNKYKSAAIYDENAKDNIKTDFAKLQIQAIDYSEKVKNYNEWNATVNEARKSGTITEEQYNIEYAPKLEAEKNMLIEEKNKINEQAILAKDKSVSIDNIAANQYAVQAERGNVLSGATYSFLQGAENSLRFLLETGDFQDGEFKGLLTEAAPGSISDVYTSSGDRNTFEQVIFGLANSGGSALVGAAAGSPWLGLYASSYVNMKDQMNTPEFKDVPEYQKMLMSGVYGGTIGLLEAYGVSKWFTRSPAGRGLTNWILKRTIAEVGKEAGAEAIELSIKKNLNAAITNGLIQITSAGVIEGSTELTQEAADMVYKDVFNKMSGKEYFQNPKTWTEVADRLSKSFVLGFAGGAGMQTITQATQVGINELNKAQINNITDLIESPELKDTFKLHLKDQIISGEISKEEAKRQIDKINQIEGVLNKIPSKVDRFEAFKLITERDELKKEISGKDPDLVAAQTERVNTINDKLKQLSYAVQEQTTSEVSVQPGAESGGEMAQGKPETRPQEVTQEGQQTKEVNELQTVRDRILKIEEAKKKGELLEDSQPGELKSLKQRESELVQEIGKPINIENKSTKEIASELNAIDNTDLKKQLGIESNWDMTAEGDFLSGNDPVLAYTQRKLPEWNRQSQLGKINPESELTYDIVKGRFGGEDNKNVVTAKDENGVTVGIIELASNGGIEHIAVAPEFKGKGVASKLIEVLKKNNPGLDLSKTKLRSKDFEKAFSNTIIAEAYKKAKQDGSNPELVKAVENSLSNKNLDINQKETNLAQNEKGNIQPERSGDGRGRTESRKFTPLEGAPAVPGINGPDPQLVTVAEKYAADNGIDLKRQSEYVEVDEQRAKRIADAYEQMADNPQDPKVKEAYQDLIKQTTAQYQALVDAGYKFWFMDLNIPSNEEYASTPYNALRDLRQNKEMGVFPTTDGYGEGDITQAQIDANPLLADTGIKWPVGGINGEMKPVLANDLFRAVHDAFGHGLEGAGFRARGEENAWQAHVRLFTGPAVGAITSETRGQNSWLNYGPNGETNRTAKIEDTIFADQKIGLMPEWTWSEGRAGDMAYQENLVTNENINDIIDSQDTETRQKIAKSAKLVMKAIPEAKIYLHNNTAEYDAAIGEQTKGKEKGTFIGTDMAIHVNMEEAFPHTLLHESFHYVILNKGLDAKVLNGWAKSLRSIIKDEKLLNRIDTLLNKYSAKDQSEEFISELGAIMGAAKGQLSTSALQKFKTLINKISKAIGLPPIFTAASTTQDAVDFINTISSQLVTGDQVFANGFQTKIVPVDLARKKQVKVTENQKLTFVKQSDIVDFKTIIDDIVSKDQTVWFWVADQLGRGMYSDAEINGEHYLDAGPSYALDPENRKDGIIWASGKSKADLQKLINASDYIFIISGSPQASKLFNKSVFDLYTKKIGDYQSFKEKLLKSGTVKALRDVLDAHDSWASIMEDASVDNPKAKKIGTGRKKFLIALNESLKKPNSSTYKLLDSLNAIIDVNSLRDGFYLENNFEMGDVMLVLKPTGVGGKANHSTYENNVLGEVVGVPDIIVNSYDIMPEEVRNKYKDDIDRAQQQQVVAPYGAGIKKVQQVTERKKQKGFSKQEAIRKAKEKYALSVKERGNTPEQGVTSALEDLRKSEWYNEADDVMREEAERELKKFFGEKMKAAPSIKKVMAIKPTKIQVEEMAALKSQIRLEAKAAREAKGDLNTKRKALATAITGMVRQGKITAMQARSIINKVSRVNLDNPVMVDRLISYAERVFDRADYQETLSKAAKIRKSIKRAMKSKDLQAEVAAMAKKFSGVDPFMVEDIDQYIENAEKVLNAVRPVRETGVPLRQAADIEAISEYTTAQFERQEANKKAELLALNKYLVDAGIITDDMTTKEIQEMIDIIAAEEYEVENADKKLNFLKNRFEFMSGVIEEMIVNNKDIFTDEALDLTQSQKDLMREVLKFDIDKLSVKQAAQVLEAMDNFINNGITSGLEAVVKSYIGNENANNLADSGLKSRPLKMYWNKAVGRFFGEQFVSLPLLIERMFPGMKKGLKLMSDMGLTDVIKGAAKADREHKMIVKDYTSQEFYKGKGFMKAENVYERGMIAFLSRNLAGTKSEMRNEFLRRIKMVEESINALMTGSETERKMGEVYQKIFNKLKVNSQDLDVIKANAEQMNLDAVDWMTQQWAEKYSNLSDISLSVYNAILGSDTNYTPDRYKGLDESDIELDENLLQKGSAFMGGLEYTDKNKSGVLIETTRPKTLPKGRFVSLDFDVNNFSSLKGAMIDIETAPAIRQVDGFIKSDGYKRIVNGDDRKILTRRINNYIISIKGKTAFTRDSMRSVERLANFLGSLGVGKALGGFDQTIKQTAPVIINTLINAGRFDGLNFEMNAAINRSGMPIANRGIEAISGVESVDALIDKKGATAAEIGKAIEKVSQMYMKALLSKPDVWVARSSFISYYKNYLKTNGMSTDIDWKTHEWNQDAMNYAQMMVDRQQNISDEKLAGSFMNSPDPWKSVTRKVILPFATFIINQKNRMHNDLIALFGRGAETSLDDKKKAARSLIGLSAEMLAYQSIAYFIKTMVYDNIASYITGEDDEEEKKDKSFLGVKMTKKQWNATKFPVKSLVSDVISPFPLFDDAVVFGFDELMSNFPMISKEDIDKAIQDQNDARALKGQDPMDAEQEANFVQNLKDQNTYAVTFQKESLGRQYGVPGIAFDTYTELADMAELAYTGEFEDDMGFGPKKKYISKKDQELVKWSLIPMVLYSTGLAPKDAGVVSRKVVSTVKKRSISEAKFKGVNELKTELGRKPKDWEESLVMNTKKEVPALVEAIKFAERFGGLTESQGKEYAKLIEITGDYGYLDLKRIQEGETADQILKK
jgi:GNAT superfamily N-acetyltransferase